MNQSCSRVVPLWKGVQVAHRSLAFIPAQKIPHCLRVLDRGSDLTTDNLQWLQTRVFISGPVRQPEPEYYPTLTFPCLCYSRTFRILFGVNTSGAFLQCVIGFTTTLKWTNSHIPGPRWGIVGIEHVSLKASVKDESLRQTWEGWTISH